MAPAVAWRSQAQYQLDAFYRARFPGRPNSKDSFPLLLKPETSDLPEGFTYNSRGRGQARSFTPEGSIANQDLLRVEILGPDGLVVAHVDLAFGDGISFASAIVTEEKFRRRGFATALNTHIDELFPGDVVNRGGATLTGQQLRNARKRRNVLSQNIDLVDEWLTPQTHESMVILSSRGHPIAFRQGTTGSVPVTATDRILMEGATVIHNHPASLGNMSFDIQDLYEQSHGRARRGVLTTRRYRYVVEELSEANLSPAAFNGSNELLDDVFREFAELQEENLKRILAEQYVIERELDRSLATFANRAAAITLDEAEELAQHAAVAEFAKKRNWHYYRLERGTPDLRPSVIPLDPIDAEDIARRIELDYDRTAVLTKKRQQLQDLREAFEGIEQDAVDGLSDRIDFIDQLLAQTPTEVGHLNAPRWLRRSVDQAEEDHGIAEIIFSRLQAIQPEFLHPPSGRLNFEAMATRWRDRVEPKLRALGFPQRTFGPVNRSIAPLTSSRTLAHTIADEFEDIEGLRTYAGRFFEEMPSFQQITDDLDSFEQFMDTEAILFGAGGDNLPPGLRMLAKHKVQRGTGLRLVERAERDGFIDFWVEVMKDEVDAGVSHQKTMRNLLGHNNPSLEPRTRLMAKLFGSQSDDVTRESARRSFLSLAEDIEAGIIPELDAFVRKAQTFGLTVEPEELASLISTVHQYADAGKDLTSVAEAIRYEVQTATSYRKWRSYNSSGLDVIAYRNAVEELAEELGEDALDWRLGDSPELLERAADELDDSSFFRAMQRAYLRTFNEQSISGMVDNWAASAGRTPEAVAFQLAIDTELNLDRAAKRHMGRAGLAPQRVAYRNPLSKIIDRRAREVERLSNLLEVQELELEIVRDILRTVNGTIDIDLAKQIAQDLTDGLRTSRIFVSNDDGTFALSEVVSKLANLPGGSSDLAEARAILGYFSEGSTPLAEARSLLDRVAQRINISIAASAPKVQKARLALSKTESRYSIPLPAEFGAIKLRLDRLTATKVRVSESVGRLNNRLKGDWFDAFDPPKLLVERKAIVADLKGIDDLFDLPGDDRSRFNIDFPFGRGHILSIKPQRAETIDGTFLRFIVQVETRTGSVLDVERSALRILISEVGEVADELSEAQARLILGALGRTSALDVFDGKINAVATLSFMFDNPQLFREIKRTGVRLRIKTEAFAALGDFAEDRSTRPFFRLWSEQLDDLQDYVTGGRYDATLGRNLLYRERRALNDRIGDEISNLQARLDNFAADNPQHSLLLGGDHVVLDIEAFEAALRVSELENRDAIAAGWAIFQRDEQFLRRVVREMYEATQESLQFVGPRAQSLTIAKSYIVERAREAGFAKIVLADGEELIVDAFAAARSDARVLLQTHLGNNILDPHQPTTDWLRVMGTKSARNVTKPNAEFVLWRGVGLPDDDFGGVFELEDALGRVATMRFQPLNSFSTSPMSAADFVRNDPAIGQIGAMHMVRVDRKKIFSTPFTGPGCLCEQEFTVLGGAINTLTLAERQFSLDWWDTLARLRASGFVDSDEMAQWARYASLEQISKNVPPANQLKNLGLQAGLAEDFFDEIERSFSIDWDHFDEFTYDLDSHLPHLRDEIVRDLIDTGQGMPMLTNHRLQQIFPDVVDTGDFPTTDADEWVKFLDEHDHSSGALELQIEAIVESVADVDDFYVLGNELGDRVTEEYERWYRDTYWDEFVEEWIREGKTGLIPIDEGLSLEDLNPFGSLDGDATPDLTR